MTSFYGMAVLLVHVTFIVLSYQIFKRLNWKQLFTAQNYYMAQYACVAVSIAVGFLISSFVLTIIEILQNIFWSVL